MWSSVWGAAPLLHGIELDVFHARQVGIVQVELRGDVAAYVCGCIHPAGWAFAGELRRCHCIFDMRYAEREMIVAAELMWVCLRCWAEHVFDPVGAVGDLQGDAVKGAICAAAVQ